MAGTLTPTPYQTVLDDDGVAVSGAKIYTYEAGTTTNATTYTTSALSVANANPIVADSAGRYVAYLAAGANLRFIIKTSADVTIDDQDNIQSVPGASVNLDIEGTVGEAVTAGQVLYMSSGAEASPLTAGLWYLTDADAAPTSTTAQTIGVAVSAIAINTSGTIRLAGLVTTAGAVVVGTTYYVSATAGAITSSAPTLSRQVGVAMTTSSLLLAAGTRIVGSIPNPITQDLLFTDATYDIGKSGATRPRDLFASRNAVVGGTLGVTGVTTLGTIGGGTWNGTAVAAAYGGTGQTSYTAGDLTYASGVAAISKLGIGANTNVLTSNGSIPQWSTRIGNAAMPTNVDLGGSLDVTGRLLVDSVGPSAIGQAVSGTTSLVLGGAFTSDGSSNYAYKVNVAGSLTGAAGDTARLALFRVGGTGVTTAAASETTTLVTSVFISEPSLTKGSGSSVTNATALYIDAAPSGATNNFALFVDSGLTALDGGVTFNSSETTAANTLDDYEEGTFTPVLTGTTSASGVGYDTQSGVYTKIGDLVYVLIYLALNAKGTIAGFLKITGLPFTNGGHAAPLAVSAQQVAVAADYRVSGPVYGSSAYMYLFRQKQSTATSDVQMDSGDITDSSILNFSGSYKV